MVPINSLDVVNIIAAQFTDVCSNHGTVFSKRSCRLTTQKVIKRINAEGSGFLTKALPRLGKSLDKALTSAGTVDSIALGFKPQAGSKLPIFMGEFFNRVLHSDGTVLRDPCVVSIGVLRNVLYLFYKYELPYTATQEQKVLAEFVKTEQDLAVTDHFLRQFGEEYQSYTSEAWSQAKRLDLLQLVRGARINLNRLFELFDPRNIQPRHGPGVVSTNQRLWAKYQWSNVSRRITDKYPFDAYYCASLGHVCDSYREFSTIGEHDLPAKVLLVPKDSRGPRLISCEPVDFQWVQQGLGRAIVQHVESSNLTRFNVFFTDQGPNQRGALLGSSHGRYATLDLKEASDRVSLELVRLLFPSGLTPYLEACRSLATRLPSGEVLQLRKFAPMGSALCFPIMALTIWALLSSGAPDQDTCESILVYGDDVIVPTAYAADAIYILESFGLKVNRDKSCTKGFFRESCGVDAYKGVNVTPVRLRTVWAPSSSPESYESWLAYANRFYDRRSYATYDLIVGALTELYWPIPTDDLHLGVSSLRELPVHIKPPPSRVHQGLQKRQWRVLMTKAPAIHKEIDGWSMLLRYFAEACHNSAPSDLAEREVAGPLVDSAPFSVRKYTKRRASILVRRWR